MSSFRWGMVACSTLTYGQMAYRKVQATYVFSSLQYCCFPSCFCLISLGSAAIPLHFRLSFCNPLVQIRSPYLIWKRTFRAICWYKNLDYGPSDRHFMTKFLKEMGQASYIQKSIYTPITIGAVCLFPVKERCSFLPRKQSKKEHL